VLQNFTLGLKEIPPLSEGSRILSLNYSFLVALLDLIIKEIPSTRAGVFLVDEKKQVIFQEVRENGHSEKGSVNQELIDKALDNKQPIITCDSHESVRDGDFECRQKSIICLPLVIEEIPAGILYLERMEPSGVFTQDDLELLVVLSMPIRWILKNRQEFEKTRQKEVRISESLESGKSEAFKGILTLIDRVKDRDIPVFICGESGTGKELVARTIHTSGTRKKGKFVAVNCGAIPEHLLESELFGFVKGAFTGAMKSKLGLIEEANGGTFFLDEICDLPLNLQAKLLRLLQEKEIRRIGENMPHSVNGRFMSATNKNIEREVECGNFREDLYYRLKIITIELPPLRERKEDLPFLLNHFLEIYCLEMKRPLIFFSPRALELLIHYSWPGNVRELQNEIQRCLVFAGDGILIKEEYLSPKINPQAERSSDSSYNFFRARAEFEKRFLYQALVRWNFNRVRTAEEVGLSRQGLFKLMKKHKITVIKESRAVRMRTEEQIR
jgi:transcriptional regulator with GAF, ATPase, and Fis domain